MDAKKTVITGSIVSVLIGLMVVGVLIYRSRALQAPPVQPPAPVQPAEPGGTPLPSPGGTATTTPPLPADDDEAFDADFRPPDFSDEPDTDGDGLKDPQEAMRGTDPKKADTDGDTYTDFEEMMLFGTDPLDGTDHPVSRPAPKGSQPQ